MRDIMSKSIWFLPARLRSFEDITMPDAPPIDQQEVMSPEGALYTNLLESLENLSLDDADTPMIDSWDVAFDEEMSSLGARTEYFVSILHQGVISASPEWIEEDL